MSSTKVKVAFFQRRPRAFGNESIEAIFSDVRNHLVNEIDAYVRIAPCLSNGLIRRSIIALDAGLHRREVNHVTGDINYAALGLPSRSTVLTVLDCGDVVNRKGLAGRILRTFWFRWPVWHVSRITTISEASKKAIIELTRCDPSKIRVVPVAISKSYQPAEFEFNSAVPRLLQVGTAPNKNIERLFMALRGLPCKLTIIGHLSAAQLHAAKTSGVDFENFPRLEEKDLVRAYMSCDIVTFASTVEGFGMPILEGQSVGRPVLTSNISSMPEVAGKGACFVSPWDVESIRNGIQRIVASESYRSEIIRFGFENAKRFDAQNIAKLYLEVYQEIYSQNLTHHRGKSA